MIKKDSNSDNDDLKASELAEILKEIQEKQTLQARTLAKIEKWFQDQEKNVAYVTSAIPLNDRQKEELEKALDFIFGKNFTIENKVNKKVLGGLKIKIGSQVIDATILNQLERLKLLLVDSI